MKKNTAEARNELMKYAYLMNEVKPVSKIPLMDVISLQMAAEYLEMSTESVRTYYANHRKELEKYGTIKLSAKDFESAGYSCRNEKLYIHVEYNGFEAMVFNTGMRCVSETALFILALGISGSEVADIIRSAVDKKCMEESEALANADNEDVDPVAEQDTFHEPIDDDENDIVSFVSDEFGMIRIVKIDDEPWFVGKDVAQVLGYEKPRNAIATHVDEDDALKWGVTDSLGRNQEMTIINESGLYSLILSSKLPTAKRFKKWVTSEVLPSIRKHGAYMTPQTLEAAILNPDTMIRLCQQLKAEQEKNAALTTANLELTTTNKAMSKDINTWDKGSVLTALIRSYATNCCRGVYGIAYNIFYKELLYNHHINLKARQARDFNRRATIKYLWPEEIDDAIALAAAMCEEKGINVGNVINSVNAGTVAV